VITTTTQRIYGTVAGVALGSWIGRATRDLAYSFLAEAALAFALLIQLSSWLYWLSLDGRISYAPMLWSLPATGSFATATFTHWWWHCTRLDMQRRRSFHQVVAPTSVLLSAVYCVVVALSLPIAGPLLHASCLALGLVGLSAGATFGRLGLFDYSANPLRTWLFGLVILATGANAVLANQVLPLRVVHNTPHPIIHYEVGRSVDLKVTSVQGAFNVFVAGQLRFSTLDHARWAEALTRPALARVPCPKNALVMSMGEGLIERELLRDQCIATITSVLRDATILNAARRQPWWRKLTNNAWRSHRIETKEADPAYWVQSISPHQQYDLVIVDMPDPEDFANAKFYSRYFYRQIRKHMTEQAILVVQATSALRSPNTFASIRATLESANLVTIPYRVALTTLGEWSFLLSQKRAIAPVSRPEWLRDSALGALETFALAPDSVSSAKGQVSRLDEPTVMEIFLSEEGLREP
jgi:spermidine synthase